MDNKNTLFPRVQEWKWWTKLACVFWVEILILSFITSLLSLFGGRGALSHSSTWMFMLGMCLSAAVVVHVLCEITTPKYYVSTSRLTCFLHHFNSECVGYIATSAVWCAINLCGVFALVDSSALGPLLTNCEMETRLCTHNSTLTIVVYGLLAGAVFSTWRLHTNGYVLKFPVLQQDRLPRVYRRIIPALKEGLQVTLLSVGILFTATQFYDIFFGYTRSAAHYHYTHEDAYQKRIMLTQSHSQFAYLLAASLGVLSLFSFAHYIVDVFFTKAFTLDYPYSFTNRHVHLVEGLKAKNDPLLLHHAYLDLYRLANFSRVRRQAIFADPKGTAWTEILTSCRKQIENLTLKLQEGVIRETEENIAHANGADPTTRQSNVYAFMSTVSQIFLPVLVRTWMHNFLKPILNFKRSIMGGGGNKRKQNTTPANTTNSDNNHQAKAHINKWHEVPTAEAVERAFNVITGSPSVTQKADYIYQNLQPVTWAVNGVSRLTAYSKTEDQMGIVLNTNTLSTLLCILIECVFVNDEYARIVSTRTQRSPLYAIAKLRYLKPFFIHRMRTRGATGNEGFNTKFLEMPPQIYQLADVLNSCIYLLVATYYENLSYFKFPPKIAAKLQSYIDFKE